MSSFRADLSILPSHQRALWAELRAVPPHFVLYGGTAIALRLGHRQSVDFDFMTHESFRADELARSIPFLETAERLQSRADTLTVSVDRGLPVAVSFFGGLRLGRVGTPDRATENGVRIASLLDLAGTKAAVLQQRAEAKDYLDLHAIIQAGIKLETALAAARALYGAQFNPAITLKALAYYGDGDLSNVPPPVKDALTTCAVQIGVIPDLPRLSDLLGS